MKRDLDLSQKILEVVAAYQDPAGISQALLIQTVTGIGSIMQAIKDDGYVDLNHQMLLLTEAGFLFWREGNPYSSEIEDFNKPSLCHLTWAGHDLLESLSKARKG